MRAQKIGEPPTVFKIIITGILLIPVSFIVIVGVFVGLFMILTGGI